MRTSRIVPSMIRHLPVKVSKVLLSSAGYMSTKARDRLTVLRNLKLALGPDVDDKSLVRISVRNVNTQVRKNVDTLIILNGDRRRVIRHLERRTTVEGLNRLERHLRHKKGVILLSFHLGAFYLIPPALALRGFNITDLAVVPPVSRKLLEDGIKEVDQQTDNFKLKLIPLSKMVLRSLAKVLRNNEIVVLRVDVNIGQGDGTVKIEFMNRMIRAGYGAAWLHKKTGAPLVPVFITGTNGRNEILIDRHLETDETLTFRQVTQEIFRVFERRIRQEPENWDRWKHFHEMLCDK